jgi:hypothetical protein
VSEAVLDPNETEDHRRSWTRVALYQASQTYSDASLIALLDRAALDDREP